MAKKGQKFVTYSFEIKKKAIELRLQGMTKAKVAEELGIVDIDRLKVWMRRYNQMGEFGLTDSRGRRKNYVDENRYVSELRNLSIFITIVVCQENSTSWPQFYTGTSLLGRVFIQCLLIGVLTKMNRVLLNELNYISK